MIGRKVNYKGRLEPIAVTIVSMGIGSTIMLVSGLLWEGITRLSGQSLLIMIVLAVVNTAFTFVMLNYSSKIEGNGIIDH